MLFQDTFNLEQHKVTCHYQNKFLPNIIISPYHHIEKSLRIQLPTSNLFQNMAFTYISLKTKDQVFHLTISCQTNNRVKFSTEFKSADLTECAKKLLQILPLATYDSKTECFQNNIQFLASLQHRLEQCESNKPLVTSKANQLSVDVTEIKKIQNFMVKLLSSSRVFISTMQETQCITQKFLKTLLKLSIQNFPDSKIDFSPKKIFFKIYQ